MYKIYWKFNLLHNQLLTQKILKLHDFAEKNRSHDSVNLKYPWNLIRNKKLKKIPTKCDTKYESHESNKTK